VLRERRVWVARVDSVFELVVVLRGAPGELSAKSAANPT
jgi:hypothetical protein